MTEIFPNLYVEDEQDYELIVKHQRDWRVVHACKEPYHRQALGYRTRGAPKDHREYLTARRGDRLILNLVDAPDPAYIPKEIFDAALEFIHESLDAGYRVLVHCNLGESRGPAVGLVYLAAVAGTIAATSYAEAAGAFRAIYPRFSPGRGIDGFLKQNWQGLCHRSG